MVNETVNREEDNQEFDYVKWYNEKVKSFTSKLNIERYYKYVAECESESLVMEYYPVSRSNKTTLSDHLHIEECLLNYLDTFILKKIRKYEEHDKTGYLDNVLLSYPSIEKFTIDNVTRDVFKLVSERVKLVNNRRLIKRSIVKLDEYIDKHLLTYRLVQVRNDDKLKGWRATLKEGSPNAINTLKYNMVRYDNLGNHFFIYVIDSLTNYRLSTPSLYNTTNMVYRDMMKISLLGKAYISLFKTLLDAAMIIYSDNLTKK